MKNIVMVLSFALVTIVSFGQEFIGIKVDGKLNDVVEKFKQKGLKVTSTSNPQVVGMKGVVANREIELNIVCTPKTKVVWKFAVYLPEQTSWTTLKGDYEEFLEILIKKYGEPESKYNFFSSPYKEGDGYEMTGVAAEKCTYSAFWPDDVGLFIQISKWKQVKINYENRTNSALSKKEEDEIKVNAF